LAEKKKRRGGRAVEKSSDSREGDQPFIRRKGKGDGSVAVQRGREKGR